MDFTAIDFETATSNGTSICSMGICLGENSLVVEQKEILIKPDPFEYNNYNIMIHGITPKMVAKKPRFCDIWEDVRPYIDNRIIVAHNASFDVGAMCDTLDHYGIEYPTADYLCTVILSQKAYPELKHHKLNVLCDWLGIGFSHHHAAEDAYACAMVLLRIMEENELESLEDIEECFGITAGRIYPELERPAQKKKKKAAKPADIIIRE